MTARISEMLLAIERVPTGPHVNFPIAGEAPPAPAWKILREVRPDMSTEVMLLVLSEPISIPLIVPLVVPPDVHDETVTVFMADEERPVSYTHLRAHET